MEDLIYVLLAIVWLLFSVANAKKKKQQAAPTTLPKNPLEDLFDEFLPKVPSITPDERENQSGTPYPAETIMAENTSLETLQPIGPYDAYTGEWKAESLTNYDPTNILSQLSFTPQPDEETEIGEKEKHSPQQRKLAGFNLRNAIVYQTILQRPDF
ncbi:hypothetical protein MASR2M12_16210 [Bacteroidales bacterium]